MRLARVAVASSDSSGLAQADQLDARALVDQPCPFEQLGCSGGRLRRQIRDQLLPASPQRGQSLDLPPARELQFELGVLVDRLVGAQRGLDPAVER